MGYGCAGSPTTILSSYGSHEYDSGKPWILKLRRRIVMNSSISTWMAADLISGNGSPTLRVNFGW